jgi:hypothetical protein
MVEGQTTRLATGDRIAIAVGCLAAAVAIALVAFEYAYPDATTTAWRVILFVAITVAIAAVAYLAFDLAIRPRLRRPVTLARLKPKIPAILAAVFLIAIFSGGYWYVAAITP